MLPLKTFWISIHSNLNAPRNKSLFAIPTSVAFVMSKQSLERFPPGKIQHTTSSRRKLALRCRSEHNTQSPSTRVGEGSHPWKIDHDMNILLSNSENVSCRLSLWMTKFLFVESTRPGRVASRRRKPASSAGSSTNTKQVRVRTLPESDSAENGSWSLKRERVPPNPVSDFFFYAAAAAVAGRDWCFEIYHPSGTERSVGIMLRGRMCNLRGRRLGGP